MPRYMVEVPDVHHAITRPIIRQITEVVARNFMLENQVDQVVINGLNDVISLNNSTVGENNNQIRIDSDARIEVEFEETVENPTSIAILRDEHMPVFYDEDLHVSLKPVYTEVALTLTFKYIAKDQSSATAWQRRAELQSYRQMHKFLTTIDYHYLIPTGVARQLWVIHALRERAPTRLDEEFGKWLRRCSWGRFTTVSNYANKGTMLAVPELQTRVHGWFDFSYQPQKVEKRNEASAWQSQFSVTLHYDRADAVVIDYPIMVHNQIIPEKYRDNDPIEHSTDYIPRVNRSLSLRWLEQFEYGGQQLGWRHSPRASGVRIPHFDDWLPNHIETDYVNTTSILLQFDYDDPKFIIDFSDPEVLGDYDMKPHVRDYMRDLGNHMFKHYDTLFLVSMHVWNEFPVLRALTTDRSLKVYTVNEQDTTKMWHLVINTLTDITKLSEIGKQILGRHPKCVEDWLKWRLPEYWFKIPIPRLTEYIDVGMLGEILNNPDLWDDKATPEDPAIWGRRRGGRSGWRYREYRGKPGINMVESFNIIAFKKSDNPYAAIRMSFPDPYDIDQLDTEH